MLSKEEHDELMSKVARASQLDVINKEIQQQKDQLHGENESLKIKVRNKSTKSYNLINFFKNYWIFALTLEIFIDNSSILSHICLNRNPKEQRNVSH